MTKTVSIKVPATLYRQIKGNVSQFFRDAAVEKLTHTPPPAWKPKTAHGKKLWRLRQKAIAGGMTLLTREELDAELKNRSGLR